MSSTIPVNPRSPLPELTRALNVKRQSGRWAGFVVLLTAVSAGPAWAAAAPDSTEGLRIRTSRTTGVASFVSSANGGAIAVPASRAHTSKTGFTRESAPIDFLREYGHLFGVADPNSQLVLEKTGTDALGHTHTTFRQVHQGVGVFAALLRVHLDAQGRPIAANGTFIPAIKLNTTPLVSAAEAAEIAVAQVIQQLDRQVDVLAVRTKLYVFRVNLARGLPGPDHLVYEVEVGDGRHVREFLYVDAHKGHIVDQITGICDAINRRVYDGGFGDDFLVWAEDDPFPTGNAGVDNLIEFAEDTYNLIASATSGGFLSWDGIDGVMHSVNDDPTIDCPNANWNGTSTNFCVGVTGDDTVGHEWGHAYTDSTHNLIYQAQPGALNESYSDIFGEMVDLLNGAGTDTPGPPRTDAECSTFGGSPPPSFEVNSPPSIAGAYPAGGASFNPAPPVTVVANVELTNDGDDEGSTASMNDACQPLIGFTPGNIALVDRGTCAFTTKVNNAATAGAVGVIVVNNQGNSVFTMSGNDPAIEIPSVTISHGDGETIKDVLPGVGATIVLAPPTDPSLRWLSGEDDPGFGGAIRDMWNPTCFGDPGRVSDTVHYACGPGDHGGVHTNSGIPNHAFALLVDGGTYNGQTITGIGLTKAFHIYWRAQAVYQVPATYFADHADALEQSCADLIDTNLAALSTELPTGFPSGEIIGPTECAQLSNVIAAVELRMEPVHCKFSPMLEPEAPPLCSEPGTLRRIFVEDWETDMRVWGVGTHDLANPDTFDTPDWAISSSLPDDRTGSAAFVADLVIGDCDTDNEAGVLFLESPTINVPKNTDVLRVAFDHWVATEALWDGGNVKISANGGPWVLVESAQFTFNAYPVFLNPPSNSDNPMAGEGAFSGTDGGSVGGSWGQSQLNLDGIASAGDDIRLRFEMGLDGCNGVHGWYVDEVQVYHCCPTFGDVECDGSLELDDYSIFADCLSGPGAAPDPSLPATPSACLDNFNSDMDEDVDLSDFALLQRTFAVR